MGKSLFSFFMSNRIGRKLALMVGKSGNIQKDTDSSHGVSRSASVMDAAYNSSYASQAEKIITSSGWLMFSIICTIISLLAYDFTIAFLPKSVDLSTDIILILVFIFFFIELIVVSIFRRGYFLSFWFWLDFVAMISMLPDLYLLLSLFGIQSDEIAVTNTQASKAGKSGRSAVALKAIRMVRFSRLLRVLRVFRFFQTEDNVDSRTGSQRVIVDAGSSKVGRMVSESVTKKVIVLVLVLVLVLPWLDPSGASYSSSATTASLLYEKCVLQDITDTTWTNECYDIFNEIGVPILYINVDNNELLDKSSIISHRRQVEMWSISNDKFESINTSIILDIRSSILEESILGICLTFFAILVFATATLFVTASTMHLVVQPIARLTELLMRMAGVIGLLGGAQTVEKLSKDKDELFIVEALCERIMEIFGGANNSSSDYNNNNTSNGGKALSMMASHKITQITSGDRVWEIDVKEKHRTAAIAEKVNRSFADFVKSEAREISVETDNDKYPELSSLQSMVTNPISLYCLRMFMTSNLTINNLLFVLEAEEWKKDINRKFMNMYRKYCDDRSPAQINLNATMFENISKIAQSRNNLESDLKEENIIPLNENIFEEAINETWELMEKNVFKQFLESDYYKFYIHMKINDPVTINQLQLYVPEDNEADSKKDIIRSSENTFPDYFSTER